MRNIDMVRFREVRDETYGYLVPIEAQEDVPFEIKRLYYIYNVPTAQRRGFHSHNDLQQVLVCVSGSVKILVQTPEEEQVIELDNPAEGLYIGPMVWREMYDFSQDAVLLVMASEHYTVADYIRDKDAYIVKAKEYFAQEDT